jgi:hypothetical protein
MGGHYLDGKNYTSFLFFIIFYNKEKEKSNIHNYIIYSTKGITLGTLKL